MSAERSEHAAPISGVEAMFGQYAVVSTFRGTYQLVDCDDENAPVATFVSEIEAKAFTRWIKALLSPDRRA